MPLISATETFAVSLALTPWKSGVAILVTVVNIGTAVILVISARTFDTVMEALAAKRVEFTGEIIPSTRDWRRPSNWAVHKVRHAALITAAECLTVCATHRGGTLSG